MTFSPLLLVVLASLIHASWNLLAKRAASAGAMFVLAYSLTSSIVYAPWVAYVLFRGDGPGWSSSAIALVLASAISHLAYSLCLQRGYQVADFSVVYPIARGTGPMISTLGAFLILREPVSAQGLAGLTLVLAGIGLVATRGNLSAFRRPGGQRGVRWGVTTGSLVATYTVVDAYSVKIFGVPPVVLDWFSNILRVMLLMPLFMANPGRAMRSMRGHWWIALAVGLLSPLSYILVLTALNSGAPLSVVAPMREMSMMIGALLGMLILREQVGFWRFVGCALLVAGATVLSGA